MDDSASVLGSSSFGLRGELGDASWKWYSVSARYYSRMVPKGADKPVTRSSKRAPVRS